MKYLVLFLTMILGTRSSFSQCADTGLYALIYAPNGQAGIAYYNELNSRFDTVVTIKGAFDVMGCGATIDAYNGRMFLPTYDNSYRIVIVDLNDKTVKYSSGFIDMLADVHYDPFTNNLVIRDQARNMLLYYDIQADKFYDAFNLPNGHGTFNRYPSCYNSIKGQYIYLASDTAADSNALWTVDINVQKTLYKVGKPRNPNVLGFPQFYKYDVNTDLVIGAWSVNKYYQIVSVNNKTGEIKPIIVFDSFAIGAFPTGMAAFDTRASSYFFPHHNLPKNGGSGMIEFNIKTGSIVREIKNNQGFELLQYHGLYTPELKLNDDSSLVTTYGKSYQWYKNGNEIKGAISQMYKPRSPGSYSVKVTFSCGRTEMSNEIYMDVPRVKEQLEEEQVLVYFAPGAEDGTLVFNNPDKREHSLLIFNSLGQLVQSYRRVTANFINFHRDALASGIYYYRLHNGQKMVKAGKLLIQ